ncbi:MAG TPA: 2,3-diphosphoglycerate-dependent phosphoglycerate mutase [Candidatus Gracilibacteria bacterium]
MYQLVLIRHGESEWNAKNLFTGWTDVELTQKGRDEALQSAKALKEAGIELDLAYTSYLKRAIHTLNIVLDETDYDWLPVRKDWRLNERHYGALQGFNKKEKAEEYGEEQVHLWRRSFDVPPPPLSLDDPRHPRNDIRYKALKPEQLPACESLKDTIARMMPFITDELFPAIKEGRKIIISAHGNSLRALVKYLDNIPDSEIPGLEIPTGKAFIYELDEDLKPLKHYYL